MADRGITFSATMVRALLDGRKTQTRRLLNLRRYRQFSDFGPSDTPGYDWHFRRSDACWCDFRAKDLPLPHVPGDRLYVREHWSSHPGFDGIAPRDLKRGSMIYTRADGLWHNNGDWIGAPFGKHRQAMHMPRWASRLTLLVTDVWVQRLQDISQADAFSEGCDRLELPDHVPLPPGCLANNTYRVGYAALWDSLHADPGTRWEDNPWIYAVSFDVRHGNIDTLPS
ncbi:MAG: hypothetical protein ACRDBL_04565 [Rhabdaerophilum sp.]